MMLRSRSVKPLGRSSFSRDARVEARDATHTAADSANYVQAVERERKRSMKLGSKDVKS